MKTLILAIDGLMPELFFGGEAHENVGGLLGRSAYGLLEDVIPLDLDIAWQIFESGSDAGSLGLYGRRDRSNRGLVISEWQASSQPAAALGVLSSRQSFQTAVIDAAQLDLPAVLADHERLGTEIEAALQAGTSQFYLLRDHQLAAFQMAHPEAFAGEQGAEELAALYLSWDRLLGRLAAALAAEDQLLLVSTHSLQARTGAFRLNQWLLSQGYLQLKSAPDSLARVDQLDIDWQATKAFALGGREGRIYLNLAGREMQGLVAKTEAAALRAEIAAQLQHVTDASGAPIPIQVLMPEDAFQGLEGVVPDLLLVVDGYATAVDESVDPRDDSLLQELNEELVMGQGGSFLLHAANSILEGEIPAARLEDLLPTLLHLRGEEVPVQMSGRSLLDGLTESGRDRSFDEEAAQRRLRGLGYL